MILFVIISVRSGVLQESLLRQTGVWPCRVLTILVVSSRAESSSDILDFLLKFVGLWSVWQGELCTGGRSCWSDHRLQRNYENHGMVLSEGTHKLVC